MQVYENLRRQQTPYQHFAFARLGRDTRALDEHEIAPRLPVDCGAEAR